MFNGSEINIATEYKYVGTVVSTKSRNMFALHELCQTNWCTYVKDILNEVQLE